MPFKDKGGKAQRASEKRRRDRWNERHPDRRKAATHNYKLNNKGHIKSYNKQYYQLHNEVIKKTAVTRSRRRYNTDAVRARIANRKSKLRRWLRTAKNPIGPFHPGEIRKQKLERALKQSKGEVSDGEET
jgi:hypothetical protein